MLKLDLLKLELLKLDLLKLDLLNNDLLKLLRGKSVTHVFSPLHHSLMLSNESFASTHLISTNSKLSLHSEVNRAEINGWRLWIGGYGGFVVVARCYFVVVGLWFVVECRISSIFSLVVHLGAEGIKLRDAKNEGRKFAFLKNKSSDMMYMYI